MPKELECEANDGLCCQGDRLCLQKTKGLLGFSGGGETILQQKSGADSAAVELDQFPSLIQKVLSHNGISDAEQVEACLKPSLANLHHPFEILNMQKAAQRVVAALRASEKIAVYGDFDLDGTSGAALLKRGLTMMGFEEVTVYQPHRLNEGYGFHAQAVEKLAAKGVGLIVTVDVGITGFEACERAKELGLDVIVTDHHQAKDSLPKAFTVVNPNQPDDESSLGYLAGTGVGYYLLLASKIVMRAEGLDVSKVDLKTLLDFFVIGTITDMVPLVGDNRILCKHGLIQLSQTRQAGIRALLDEQDLVGKRLTSQDIGFRLAPKLNALSRLASEIKPIDLYLCEQNTKADELVAFTLEENERRKALQKSATKQSKELLKLKDRKELAATWVFSEDFHKGVIGLVATELVRSTAKCSFVGSLNEGVISGSARAPEGQSALKGLEACSELLNGFGGHHAAAGFEVSLENAELFEQGLHSYYLENQVSEVTSQISAAVSVELSEVHAVALNWLELLEPFGVGFELPDFVTGDLKVVSSRVLKEKHLKFEVSQAGLGQRLSAIMFNCQQDLLNRFKEGPVEIVEMTFVPQWNEYNGVKSIQLLVSDLVVP